MGTGINLWVDKPGQAEAWLYENGDRWPSQAGSPCAAGLGKKIESNLCDCF